jgi:hypothetical protein
VLQQNQVHEHQCKKLGEKSYFGTIVPMRKSEHTNKHRSLRGNFLYEEIANDILRGRSTKQARCYNLISQNVNVAYYNY